jgi:hypothetical protein
MNLKSIVMILLEENYKFYVCLSKLGGIDQMTEQNQGCDKTLMPHIL